MNDRRGRLQGAGRGRMGRNGGTIWGTAVAQKKGAEAVRGRGMPSGQSASTKDSSEASDGQETVGQGEAWGKVTDGRYFAIWRAKARSAWSMVGSDGRGAIGSGVLLDGR